MKDYNDILYCHSNSFFFSAEIEWPEGDEALAPEASDLINRLLIRQSIERLGTNGAVEVRAHGFFLNMNWNSLLREKAEFIPVLDNEEDTSYFDSKFVEFHRDFYRFYWVLLGKQGSASANGISQEKYFVFY